MPKTAKQKKNNIVNKTFESEEREQVFSYPVKI